MSRQASVPRLLLVVAAGTLLVAAAQAQAQFTAGLQLESDPSLTTHEAWYQAAQTNLTTWRNELFLKTMQVTKSIHKQRVEAALVAAQRRMNNNGDKHNPPLNADRPYAQGMFQLSNPFISCPPPGGISKVGGSVGFYNGRTVEDGHKYLCGIEALTGPCTVLSIGSRADTSFEAAILKLTPCDVVTLDCTLREPLQTLGERHKFFPLCLGSEQQSKVNAAFVTLPQLMRKIGRDRAEILKMDIEAYEWDVLASLGTEEGWESSLPTQMAIEIHVGAIYRNSPSYMKADDFNNLMWPLHLPSFSQLQLLMLHLADMGYGIVSRDDNPSAAACTELVFHRITPQP